MISKYSQKELKEHYDYIQNNKHYSTNKQHIERCQDLQDENARYIERFVIPELQSYIRESKTGVSVDYMAEKLRNVNSALQGIIHNEELKQVHIKCSIYKNKVPLREMRLGKMYRDYK